jgi:hypothetical protein
VIAFSAGDWCVIVVLGGGAWRSRPLRWRAAWRLALAHRRGGRRAYLKERR